ncbi:hypothetical protein CAEBREN_25966 [Caenorhabditis brenneri]|uniref:SXP/RAL-2 family protein Ani s 5-like cation-binding domain-containing protein n=1 Tax=Caenorhabditis brenneri TaxID=135651 RepID=G0MPJ7_CAEBE|nr:hypothetical protein CAEBREN_25966 [Caenorhabditis brenneri]
MKPILLLPLLAVLTDAFYYKRTFYGDANEGGVGIGGGGAGGQTQDYVNAYYGFPQGPPQEGPRRRPMYPPQGNFFRQQHPFDFGPFGYPSSRMGDANLEEEKTDRELAMKNAKPGFWRQNQRETMDRIKKIIEAQRMNMEQKHMQIRRVLAQEGEEIKSKFADLHKRLLMKNNKMASGQQVPELSKKAKKLEKEAKKIMENKKMSIEKKQEKLDKLMLKAPESVKNELNAINDSGSSPSPLPEPVPLPAPGQMEALSRANPSMASQTDVLNRVQQTQAVVEARQIRVSEDGKTVEI